MAGFLKKFISGADFWDEEENRRQREQYAAEAAQQKVKKSLFSGPIKMPGYQYSQGSNTPAPGSVVRPTSSNAPQTQEFDFKKPLVKAASQSDFRNPLLDVPKATDQQKAEDSRRQAGRDAIERMTQENLQSSIEEEKGKTSWFNRTFSGDWKKRAEVDARNKALMKYQEQRGYGSPEAQEALQKTRETIPSKSSYSKVLAPLLSVDRVTTGIAQGGSGLYDLVTPGKGQNRVTQSLNRRAESTDKLAEDIGVSGLYKASNVPLEIATYFTPSVLAKSEKATNFLSKVASKVPKIDSLVGRFVSRTADDLLDPRNLGNEVNLTGRYTGQDSARGEDISAVDVAGNAAQSIAGSTIPVLFNGILRKATSGRASEELVTSTISSPSVLGTDSTQIAPGVYSSQDLSTPAFMRNEPTTVGQAQFQAERGINNIPDETFSADARVASQGPPPEPIDPLDIPAYQRRNADAMINDSIQDINSLAQREEALRAGSQDLSRTTEFNRRAEGIPYDSPAARATRELEARRRAISENNLPQTVAERVQAERRLNDALRARAVQESLRVPDPSSPMTFQKADLNQPIVEGPIADFRSAVQAPQYPDVPVPEISTGPDQVDNLGNPVLTSQEQVARQMIEQGTPMQIPSSANNVVEDQMSQAQRQAVADEVNMTNTYAPRTRTELINDIQDESLQQELIANAPERERVSLEEADRRGKSVINNVDDESLVLSYSQPVAFSRPEDMFAGIAAVRRLERVDTPEARRAILNITDAIAEKSSESGLWLRASQVLFDDMPPTMKTEYLINRIETATGNPLPDEVRQTILMKIEAADNAANTLRALEDQARALLEEGHINNTGVTPELEAQAERLMSAIDGARLNTEKIAGDAWMEYQQHLLPNSMGKKAADIGRTMMLSSFSGRVFDLASTSFAAADDMLTRGVSNLIGKGVNKVAGSNLESVVSSPKALWKGFKDGAARVYGSVVQGNDYVDDFLGQAKRTTRGDINSGGSRLRKFVRGVVEAPTNLTRGLREEELYRQGVREAIDVGLDGKAREVYARLRASVPDEKQVLKAEEVHFKANMLHDNPISRGLNNIANSLDKKGGGWGSTFIRNQIMPFTSWVGGNMHRTLTDKNLLWNFGGVFRELARGNTQGVVDNISRFAVNSAEAYALGYVLTQSGMLTNQDENGDNYAGTYINIGDRYIPVSILGPMSVPLTLGNAAHNAVTTADETQDSDAVIRDFANNSIGNILRNLGVSSVFGGENNLQSTVSSLTSQDGDVIDGLSRFAGNVVRQYIPGVTNDINAGIDQIDAFNPTGESPKTKITEVNPETGKEKRDVIASELAKTQARIPLLSQGMEREEGSVAPDIGDRITKGGRESSFKAEERVATESLQGREKALKKLGIPTSMDDLDGFVEDGEYDKAIQGYQYQLQKAEADPTSSESAKAKIRDKIKRTELQSNGVPITEDGIKARIESGDLDLAMEGLKYRYESIANDNDVPASKKKEIADDVTRLQITKDSFTPAMISMYDKISLTEWRALGDPESEDYDPELYQSLWAYDEALTASGVSKSSKGGDKQKYYGKKGSGGGSGRGRGSSRVKAIDTSMATQSFDSGGFKPIKSEQVSFSEPVSPIPKLEKISKVDPSRLRKISVTKGVQR